MYNLPIITNYFYNCHRYVFLSMYQCVELHIESSYNKTISSFFLSHALKINIQRILRFGFYYFIL